MKFDIHLEIDSESPEGRTVAAVIERDHISPEEAVLRTLRRPGAIAKTPAEEMIGAFSSDEDRSLLDDVMRTVREAREIDKSRNFGV